MNLLSIGGSDPSSGAGIQGDIRTFGAHGAYGLSVVTAVTSQNTSSFAGAEPVSQKMLESQLDAVLSDFEVSGAAVGMIYTSRAVRAVSRRLAELAGSVPIVADPVVESTTGGVLMRQPALRDYARRIIPLATATTPNVQEARLLLDCAGGASSASGATKGARGARTRAAHPESGGAADAYDRLALQMIHELGAGSAVVTGIKSGNHYYDVVATRDARGRARTRRLRGRALPYETHGGGCAFAASLLCGLASGMPVTESARDAKKFVTRLMRNATGAGRGAGIAGDVHGQDGRGMSGAASALAGAITEFTRIRGIYMHIPECQTNFAHSETASPRSTRDVLGIRGRIVRTGRRVAVAGDIARGGSKHVAAALVAASGRFPRIRSAVNIRYDEGTIGRITGSGMTVARYDRSLEPAGTKAGGSSVRWGVSEAVRDAESAPDAVCHDGDHGKEPMIIIFGESPDDVLAKVRQATAPA